MILPFKPRYGGCPFTAIKINKSDIFTEKRINDKISSPSFIIYPDVIMDGKVNRKLKNMFIFSTMNGMFRNIRKAVNSSDRKKYIFAYSEKFDSLGHKYGSEGRKTIKYFHELDKRISAFARSLKGTDTILLITADHGLIDTDKNKIIYMKDHPELYDTLTMPLCGEPRMAFCYVHPGRAADFERYVKSKLRYCCTLFKSSELIRKNFFGLYNSHPELKNRIGDYALIMKEDYVIKDWILKEKGKMLLSYHGGLSSSEMFVPLIKIKCG